MASLSSMSGPSVSIHGHFADASRHIRFSLEDALVGYYSKYFCFERCLEVRIETISLAAIRSLTSYYGPIITTRGFLPDAIPGLDVEVRHHGHEERFSAFRFVLTSKLGAHGPGSTFSRALLFLDGIHGFDTQQDLAGLLDYLNRRVATTVSRAQRDAIKSGNMVRVGGYTFTRNGISYSAKRFFSTISCFVKYRDVQVLSDSSGVWITSRSEPRGPLLLMTEPNALVFEHTINAMQSL